MMTNFVKIENGLVVSKRPTEKDGFIEAPGNVVCGFGYDGENFLPPPSPNHTWNGTEWVPDNASKWTDIRAKRDILLSESDWTMVSDAPTDKVAWATYRQALRDITEQPDPFNIIWPEKP